MLPFLADPKRFTNGPIARFELAHLKRGQVKGWRRWIVYLALLPVVGIATLPLWKYIGTGRGDLVVIMLVPIYTVHFTIILYTLSIASHTIAREKDTQAWDSLILTGADIRQIVLGKWWATIRHMWRWHIFSTLLKFGMAYGLAQYFHTVDLSYRCYSKYSTALCYYGNNWMYPVNPDAFQVIIAVIFIVLYGFAESGFIAGLGITASLLYNRSHIIGMILGGIIRSALIIFMVVIWRWIANYSWSLFTTELDFQSPSQISADEYLLYNHIDTVIALHNWRQLSESVQLMVSPIADGSTLLMARVMRPTGTHLLLVENVIIAVGGLWFYWLLIGAILRAAQIAAIRQRVSCPDG